VTWTAFGTRSVRSWTGRTKAGGWKSGQSSSHDVRTTSASQMVAGVVWVVTAFPHLRPVAPACTAAPVGHDVREAGRRRGLGFE